MTHLTFIRYFVPDSNEFAPGWYQTRNEGRTRIGDVPLSLSDALYDGPNRVIIDDNTPETNTLPVSGGKGVDEFLITSDANTVTINDDSRANVIVFERDVVITSIERQAGSEGASVAQYVITLSSGKTITLRNPASFTFQHLGDATRTAPISAEDFFTAYEDGFAASDASHPDIIGDASDFTGAVDVDLDLTITFLVYYLTAFISSIDLRYLTYKVYDSTDPSQPIAVINLGDAFTDADENDTLTLTLTVILDGNAVILTANGPTITFGNTGLTYNTETNILSGNPSAIGTYKIKIVAADSTGEFSAETEFDIVIAPQTISGDDTGLVTEGGAPGDDNTGTLTAPSSTITLTPKETTDSPGTSTGTYGVMRFNVSSGEWVYTLDDRAEVLAEGQTATELFTFSAGGGIFVVTITITGSNDAPVVATAIEPQSGVEGQEKVIDLSTLFTDVDEGDELTFEVTLDDGTALSTIGLTYDSDEDEITGTLSQIGEHIIKIVATDKSGATVETTFDLNILPAILMIQLSSLTYNPDETSITIDETILKITSENQSDPALLVYTITTLPDAGRLLKSGTQLNNGDTFTQADINNGLITYEPSVSDSSTSQSNPLSFTFSDGVADLEEQTLQITSREVFVDETPDQDNTIDLSVDVDLDLTITFLVYYLTAFTSSIDLRYLTYKVYDSTDPSQPIAVINLGDAFTDADENDTLTLTLTVILDGNAVILTANGPTITFGDTGLTYNTETNILSGNPSATGTYKIKIVAADSTGEFSAETEFDIVIAPQTISGDDTGSVTEGGAPGDDNTGTLTAPSSTITLTPKETTDSPGTSTGTYGVMRFNVSSGEWVYTLDDRAEVLAEGQTATELFTFSAGGGIFVVTITITGSNDAPVVATAIEPQSGVEGQEKVIDLSTLFTDVDEGDELTFEVTLDDGTALSTIGLTYDSDEDEITGTLSQIGEHIIKIVATDKSGATVETTFDLNILPAILMIQLSSLTYNPDETSITIDETILEVTSNSQFDPTLLVYTITTLPDAGRLLKSGTQLNNGDTFTQADINNGLITYEPSVSDSSTSQSNPLSFTFSDGVADLEEQTLQITSRKVVGNTASAQDNTADFSDVDVPQKIEAGDGSDIITGGQKDDQIDGGAGDDEIILTRTVNNVAEDAGADEVLYAFDYDGVGIDGGDEIVGFKRGQDKLTFVVDRNFNSLTAFLQSLNGADGEDLTADDAFVVTMQWGINSDGDFYFDGVLLHFKDVSAFGGGRVSSPLVTVTFDQQLNLNDLTEILGEVEKVAENFDFTHAAFKNLDEVLPRLFGESSVDFVVSALDRSGVIREDDEELRGTLGDAERTLENGIGAFGEIRVESGDLQTEWIYTPDDRAKVLSEGESVTEKFTFKGVGDGVDDVVITITVNGENDAPEIDTPLGIQRGTVDQNININVNNLFTDIDRSDELTLTFTVMLTGGAEATLDDIGLTYYVYRNSQNEITSREITGRPNAGTHRIKAVADDGKGGTVETTFTIQISSFSVASLDRELGRGEEDVVVDGVNSRAKFLIGGDNDQTLNTGRDGDYVFGGRGDDTINLGGGEDVVYYRYGGDDDRLEGIDGHDTINNFDLDEDFLVLARVGNGIHGEAAAFYDAIRFSTTPNSEGEITGFVITFAGGGSLTVNFDSDDFISGDDQSPSAVLGNRLQLIHFDNIGFKLNSAETNIIASPDITRLMNQSGNGVGDAEVGADDASESQFLIGGDNTQTLNASSRGDVLFGGRGDDTINLGSGDDVVYYRYDGVGTDDLESIDGTDTINNFDRGDDVLVLAYVGDDGDEIIDTTDFYGALKSIKLLVEANDDGDFTGIVFTFTDRSGGAGANDEVVLTVNFSSVFSASSSQIRTIDNAFEDAASGSEERLVKSGEEDNALAVIEDIVLGEDLQLINFADIGFKLNSIETNAVVLPNVFTFAKELGDGDDNASVGVATAASSQFLLGGDNVQTLNAGTEGDAIFGGKGDDIINLGGGKDFVFYRYDGDDTDDSEASDGADVINDFDLDEDVLVLAHESNDVHENSNAFYEAIKGISLLVDGDGNVTGIVFTFTDRSNTTQEVDLTVNFEDDLTPLTGLEAAFENASSGEREITSGQETATYGVINEIFGGNLVLIDFDDIGFELNVAVVNNAPVVDTAIGPQRGTVDLPITAIILENLFSDVDDDELTLTVTGLPSGLSYARDTGITGTPDTVGTFMVTVVANDGNGGTVETTFDIVVSAQAVSPFSPGDGLLDRSGEVNEDDPEVRGTLGDAERELENGIGVFGEIRVEFGDEAESNEWIYTPDERAQVLSEGESVTEIFTFIGGDGVDDVVITITVNGENDAPEIDTPLGIQRETVDRGINIDVNNLFTDIDRSDELTLTFTVMLTDDTEATLDEIGLTYNENRNSQNEITSREITGRPNAGTHRIKAVADDGKGGTVETTFTIQISSFSVASLDRELGRGEEDVVVDGVNSRAKFLIGGDNDQTLNTGRDGDYVFGGRGDDTINLGGGEDVVYYRYGGDDDRLEGIDGHDTINNFDLDEDFLVLARVGNGIHGEAAAFYDAIRFSTTPNSEGEITGFVITFAGGGSLTVNFDSDDFISGDDQSPSAVLGNRLQLIHFDNIGFKLNSAETNIIASPDITRLMNQSGNGVGDAEVGADDASESQFLIGGDNTQTLNASSRGDVLFGGRGDDTINLGSGDDVVYYRYDGVGTDDLESIDGTDTINNFDRGDDVLVLAYVGDDGDEIIDTTDFYGALKSIKLLVEANDDGDFTGIVFTFTDRSDGAGANDEVVLTVNFSSVFSASSSQIRTIDNAFEDAASGSEERLVKSGEEDNALAVIEDIVLGEDLQLINFADIGFKLNSIETNAVVLPNVFTFAKELGDGDDNASVGVATAASSQFLLGGDNVQTLNAGTEGDAIFGGKGDDIINLGGGKDFVFYRYDGDDTDDSEASDGADVINDFDLDEDVLVLAHESNDVHENSNAFYEAIKGISLLVDGDGNVTGIVFTFTDRSNTTQEVDLTVNFEDDLTPLTGLEAAFENASSGEREITSGQETAAYGVINEIFSGNLVLIDFDDISFELNTAETDIV